MKSKDKIVSFDRVGVEPYQDGYRWVILALLWLLYASFSIVSRSIAPLVTPILKDLNLSYSQMGLILGAWQLIYIVVALIAGTIIDKWGVRKSLFIGAAIIGLSAVLRHFPKGFETMLAVVALFGIGGPMISIGCPKTTSLWFKGKDRGTAVGIYMTGNWIGGIIVLSITNGFIMPLTGYSWRLTFVCYGLLTFVIALLWWSLGKDIRPTVVTESPNIWEVFSKLIRLWNIKIVLIIGILMFATFHGFTIWLPKILENSGLPSTKAGFMASIPLASGIIPVLFISHWIAPQLRGRFIAFISLINIVTLFIVFVTSGFLLFIGLILFGIAYCSFPILILILMDTHEVGSKYMGSAGGMFFCVAEVGGFTAPLIMGVLVDITGTFLTGAFFLAGVNLTIFILALLLKKEPIKN